MLFKKNYKNRINLFIKWILYTSSYIFFFTTTNLHSAYLTNIPCVIVQPNGEVVNAFISGDEYHNWYHDVNGFTIIFDREMNLWCWASVDDNKLYSTGFPIHNHSPELLSLKKYANISEQEYARKRYGTSNSRLHPNGGTPSVGVIQSILIFIRFNGEDEFEKTTEYYNTLFNDVSNDKVSVRSFYQKESYGKLDFYTNFYPIAEETMVVSYEDIYTRRYFMPTFGGYNPEGYDGDEFYGEERMNREHQLLKRAVEAIAEHIPTDLIIDSNEDGDLDHLNVIIKGVPAGWNQLLSSHQGVLNTDDVYLLGKRIQAYNINIEEMSNINSFCHEIGHSIGMPDLYKHSISGFGYLPSAPIGYWDLMSLNMLLISTYMKQAYTNWLSSALTKEERIAEIPVITTSGVYSLNRGSNSPTNNIYRINSPNSTEELLILEYTKGYVSGLEYVLAGILFYRTNPTLYGNMGAIPNELWIYRPSTNTSPPEAGIIDFANFTSTLARTTLNDFTNPASLLSDGSPGGFSIYNIGENTSECITFSVEIMDSSEKDLVKNSFRLFNAFPNPFNPTTTIKFTMKDADRGTLEIFNIKGQKVKTLLNDYLSSGEHTVVWNGDDDTGHFVGSGIYFYRMQTSDYNQIKKMILLK